MDSDDEENKIDTMRQKVDDWANTIVEFTAPYRLSELCIPEQVSNSPEPVHKEFRLRLGLNDERRTQVNLLIKKKFARPESAIDLNSKSNPNRLVLIVNSGGTVIGTVTLCFDTPLGLDVDKTFKAEVDSLRAAGKKLAEITDFAAEGDFNNKRLMASIVHITYIYARSIHGCTDFVIEVNARHSRYYETMLGFKRCGSERLCSWTNGPAILLCLDLDYMDKQIGKIGGSMRPSRGEKSLYPYFFDKRDEIGITRRLMLERDRH